MAADTGGRVGGWQFGLHPAAVGAIVRSIERRDLEIGDALRLELETPGSAGVVHVQCFIATRSGGWAMWISSAPDDLAAHDAALAAIRQPEDDADADGGLRQRAGL